MSLHLSATTGEPITQAQLLGEETEAVEARTAEAEKSLKELERKMRKAGM